MKIKVTKTFAKFINDCAKEMGFKVSAKVVSLKMNEYKWNVDFDIFSAYDYGDYDWENGLFRAIRLDYPSNYYSVPHFLTTKRLNHEYKSMNVSDLDGLKRMVRDMCEI